MEMCYNGALTMPKNFVAVKKDEMEYVNAGWSFRTLCGNLAGLAGACGAIKWTAQHVKANGKTIWAWITGGYALAKSTATSLMSGFIAKIGISAATFSRILAAALVVGAVVAIGVLGSYKLFY